MRGLIGFGKGWGLCGVIGDMRDGIRGMSRGGGRKSG